MTIRLSHSALEKYRLCPTQYKLHYIDKIRSTKLGSALIFGSAVDEALNNLLETKYDPVPDTANDNLEDLYKIFDTKFTYVYINKEFEDVRTSHSIEYFRSDFDHWLLTDSDVRSLERFIRDGGYEDTDPIKLYEEVSELIKEGQEVDSTDLSYFNYASWLSLRRKGHLMLKVYKDEIIEKIQRVHSIQRTIKLVYDSGDYITGLLDFEAELVGHEGIYTVDNKTSSKNYKVDDINDKGQLPLYDEYTENGQAAYIVLLKKLKYNKTLTCKSCGKVTTKAVRKCAAGGTGKNRCNGELTIHKEPYVSFQILVDKIDEDKKDLHFQETCAILDKIENEEFPENRDSCYQFGRKCPYYDYCRSDKNNRDITGLNIREK